MDHRVEQLIVRTAIIDSLMKQKIYFESELCVETQRLAQMKAEGAHELKINRQQQVIKKVKSMLPAIVRKVKCEYELFERFLAVEKNLAELDGKYYAKAARVMRETKENLERTT